MKTSTKNVPSISVAKRQLHNAIKKTGNNKQEMDSSIKAFALACDTDPEAHMEIIPLVNADPKAKYENFESKYGKEFCKSKGWTEAVWNTAREILDGIRRKFNESHANGAQEFSQFCQTFKRHFMLYQGTKQSNDAEERAEKNSELVQEIADKKKTTTTSDTTKLNNKIKSAKNRLKEIKQVFAEIKKLEKSREVKQDITENLIDAISNVEYNLVEITGGK
tara:strand:+ start:101 stop:763 length:663 start_codon:yes stop_codon:yes gene_type:complete